MLGIGSIALALTRSYWDGTLYISLCMGKRLVYWKCFWRQGTSCYSTGVVRALCTWEVPSKLRSSSSIVGPGAVMKIAWKQCKKCV
jgi:hypothetical protein